MRIAMLGHKRVPSREGGVEIVVEELATRMVQSGNEVVCYNRSGHHVSGRDFDVQAQKEYKGIKLKSVFTIDKKGLAAMSASFFGAILCTFGKYDVIHFHAEGPCAMLWLPKLFGKRCIATIHGIDWKREKWSGFARKYIHFGEKVVARYADEIIVLSKGIQEYFMDTYGRATVFIPNGVSRPEIRKADIICKYLGLRENEYILFLGRIVPEKGLRYLVESFRKVKTDKKLVIAGGYSDTEAFMQELSQKAAADPRILFTGFVQGRLLEELYSNAYFYTLPSDLEGMPLSLLEAMSYGNCCLTSDIAECAEVVEDHAVLFQQGNVDDLQEKLQYLCDHPCEVQHYRRDAADFICNKYNWDEIASKTASLYREEIKTDENIARK